MKANDLDKLFDDWQEEIVPHLDLQSAHRLNLSLKRVNVDLPTWMMQQFDHSAKMLDITRQALIKMWLAEQLRHSLSQQ